MVSREALDTKLARPSWSPETRRSARAVARGFFTWCESVGVTATNPAAALASVTVPPGFARPASDPVIRAALEGADDRVNLMIRFAAFCGMRCCEIARVHARDWDGERLIVHGKGQKLRTVPVLDARLRMALNTHSGWIFPGPNGPLSAGHVSVLLSRALPQGITGHMLRHRFATVAYHQTRDLLAVGSVLGHSKPETTKRYVQQPYDALVAVVAAAAG